MGKVLSIVAGAAMIAAAPFTAGVSLLGFSVGAELLMMGGGLVLSGISRMLTKPTSYVGYTIQQPVAARQVVYGHVGRLPGVYTFVDTSSDGQYVYLVITFAGHQIQAFNGFWFNGDYLILDETSTTTGCYEGGDNAHGTPSTKYAGLVNINCKLGAPGEPAFAGLIALDPNWTSACRQDGCASVFIRIKYDPVTFSGGIPNIVADVLGNNQIYDPRTATTGYTNNAALCLRDYIMNAKWGLAVEGAEMDDWQTGAAANVCDEQVTLQWPGEFQGETESRYTIDGSFGTDSKPSDVIQSMLAAMAGRLTNIAGLWSIFPGAYLTPTPSLDESDLAGPIEVITSVQKTDLCNGVKGTFICPDNNWVASDFPPRLDSTYLAEDQGEILWRDAALQFTISNATAQRLAKIELERTRRQCKVTLTCKLTAYKIRILDTVQLSIARYGWSNKTFEVMDLKFNPQASAENPAIVITLQLQEVDADIFDWTPIVDEKEWSAVSGVLVYPGPVPSPTQTLSWAIAGMPLAGATSRLSVALPTYIPADFAGSTASAGTPATADAVFYFIQNGIIDGNVTFPAGGGPLIWSTGGLPLTFNPGDFIVIQAPTPQDATLADISITLLGSIYP